MQEQNPVRRGLLLAVAAGIGAGLMYFGDRERGRRRRARMTNRALHWRNRADRLISQQWHDLSNRTAGLVAEWQARLRPEQISEQVLEDRVRAKLGRVISHPHSIEVSARAGQVILGGRCVTREVPRLLAAVRKIRGVRQVVDQMTRKANERRSA